MRPVSPNHCLNCQGPRSADKTSAVHVYLQCGPVVGLYLEGVPENEPIPHGFHEIGFTTYAVRRLKDHSRHRSSNTLMNLFEPVAGLVCPGVYKLRGIVIHRMRSANLAAVAEIYVSIRFNAWACDGTGFTHQWPGVSANSADNSALMCGTDMPYRFHGARTYHMRIVRGEHQIRHQEQQLPGPAAQVSTFEEANDNLEAARAGLEEIEEEIEGLLGSLRYASESRQ